VCQDQKQKRNRLEKLVNWGGGERTRRKEEAGGIN